MLALRAINVRVGAITFAMLALAGCVASPIDEECEDGQACVQADAAPGGSGGITGGDGGMTGGSGGMTGGSGGMTGGSGGGEPDAGGGDSATFTDVYSIIEMRCGGGAFGCHVMGSSGMLDMQTKMNAFMNLVGVESQECDGETRVIAGDADNSLLIKALEGTACVDRMPDGRDPLSEDEIATIRAWIDDGAMDN